MVVVAKSKKASKASKPAGTKAGSKAGSKAAPHGSKKAMGNAAAAAPPGSQPRIDNTCRRAVYDQYRMDCAAKFNKGGPAKCALTKECADYGVGSEYWPVETWKLPPENIKQLTHDLVQEGRNCMTHTMWKDDEFLGALKNACGEADLKNVPPVLQRPLVPAAEVLALRAAREAEKEAARAAKQQQQGAPPLGAPGAAPNAMMAAAPAPPKSAKSAGKSAKSKAAKTAAKSKAAKSKLPNAAAAPAAGGGGGCRFSQTGGYCKGGSCGCGGPK